MTTTNQTELLWEFVEAYDAVRDSTGEMGYGDAMKRLDAARAALGEIPAKD